MRCLWIFASAYLLLSAVACQPLREAKAELEVSQRRYRKPPTQPSSIDRPAAPKIKRKFQALTSATDAVSDMFSRFGSRLRGAKDAAEGTEANLLSSHAENVSPPKPFGAVDANEPRLKPIPRPFAFSGNEAGYSADADRDMLKYKPYERPPLTSSHADEANMARIDPASASESAIQGETKRYKHMWNDPRQRPKMAIAAAVSTVLAWLLARNIRQDLENTANLNAALESSQAQQQQAAQQAVSDNAARQASGTSPRVHLRRRQLDSSLVLRTPSERGDTAETASQEQTHLEKRFNPLRMAREHWQRVSVADGARNTAELLRSLPANTKAIVVKYVLGAAAMLSTGLALLFFYYKALRHPDPEPTPANSSWTPLIAPSSPSTAPDPSEQIVHIESKKHSLHFQEDELVHRSRPHDSVDAKTSIDQRIRKRMVPNEQASTTINAVNAGLPATSRGQEEPANRRAFEMVHEALQKKGPIAVAAIGASVIILLGIGSKYLIQDVFDGPNDPKQESSASRPSNRLVHRAVLKPQDRLAEIFRTHEQEMPTGHPISKRMTPIREGIETDDTVAAAETPVGSAHRVPSGAMPILDGVDELMQKRGPIAVTAIVLTGLAFIGVGLYKIYQYEHEKHSNDDPDRIDKASPPSNNHVRHSVLIEPQETFAAGTMRSHDQTLLRQQHASKRMVPMEQASNTRGLSIDQRAQINALFQETLTKKGPIALAAIGVTGFSLIIAGAYKLSRDLRSRDRANGEPERHFESLPPSHELVRRALLQSHRVYAGSGHSHDQTSSSDPPISKRMMQMGQILPGNHAINLEAQREAQRATARVTPIDGDEPAATVDVARTMSPEALLAIAVAGVVLTGAGLGALYALWPKAFKGEDDTQNDTMTPLPRKRSLDEVTPVRSLRQHQSKLVRRGLFLPGAEDVIEDAKMLFRRAQEERPDLPVQRLGGDAAQPRSPQLLVITLMGLATIGAPLAGAGVSWERKRAQRRRESLVQERQDADQHRKDSVKAEPKQHPDLTRRSLFSPGSAEAIIEEARLLSDVRGRRFNRPLRRLGRQAVRHRQGEVFAAAVAAIAIGTAAGLAWSIPHKRHEDLLQQWDVELKNSKQTNQERQSDQLSKRALTLDGVINASEEAQYAVRMQIARMQRAVLRRLPNRRPPLPVQYLGPQHPPQQRQPSQIPWKTIAQEVGPYAAAAAIGGAAAWYLGPKIIAAEEELKRERLAKKHAVAMLEHQRLQAELEHEGAPNKHDGNSSAQAPLSRRSISQLSEQVKVAVDDIKSLASSTPMSPLDRQDRARRMRKYAKYTAAAVAVKAAETYLAYEVIHAYKEEKEIQRLRDQRRGRQEQTQQEQEAQLMSTPNGNHDEVAFRTATEDDSAAPAAIREQHQLRKRADVGVEQLAELEMKAVHDANAAARMETEQGRRMAMINAKHIAAVFGTLLTIFGAGVGIAYWMSKHDDRPDDDLDQAPGSQPNTGHLLRKQEPVNKLLHKRADVRPVEAMQMEATREATVDPRFRESLLVTRNVVGFITALTALFVAAGGITYFTMKHIKDPDANDPPVSNSSRQPGPIFRKREAAPCSLPEALLNRRADVSPATEIEMAATSDGPPLVEETYTACEKAKDAAVFAAGATGILAALGGFAYWLEKPERESPSHRGNVSNPKPRLHKRVDVVPLEELEMAETQAADVPREVRHGWRSVTKEDVAASVLSLLLLGGLADIIYLSVKDHQASKSKQAHTPTPHPNDHAVRKRELHRADKQSSSHASILQVRADVVPVPETEMEATREADLDPRFVEGRRVAWATTKDFVKCAAYLLTLIGIGTGVSLWLGRQDRRRGTTTDQTHHMLLKRVSVQPVSEVDGDFRYLQDQEPSVWAKRKAIAKLSAFVAAAVGAAAGIEYGAWKLVEKLIHQHQAPTGPQNDHRLRKRADVPEVEMANLDSQATEAVEDTPRMVAKRAALVVTSLVIVFGGSLGLGYWITEYNHKHPSDHALHKRADVVPMAEDEVAIAREVDPEAHARRTTKKLAEDVAIFSTAVVSIFGPLIAGGAWLIKNKQKLHHPDPDVPVPKGIRHQLRKRADVSRATDMEMAETREIDLDPHSEAARREARSVSKGVAALVAAVSTVLATGIGYAVWSIKQARKDKAAQQPNVPGEEVGHRQLQKRADPPVAQIEMAAITAADHEPAVGDNLDPGVQQGRRIAWTYRKRVAAYSAAVVAAIGAAAAYGYLYFKIALKNWRSKSSQPSTEVFNGDEDLLPKPKHVSATRPLGRRDASVSWSRECDGVGELHAQHAHTRMVERGDVEQSVPTGMIMLRVIRQLAIDSKRAGLISVSSSSASSDSPHPVQPVKAARHPHPYRSKTSSSADAVGSTLPNNPFWRGVDVALAQRRSSYPQTDRQRNDKRSLQAVEKRETPLLPNRSRDHAAIVGLVVLVVLYKIKNNLDGHRQDDRSSRNSGFAPVYPLTISPRQQQQQQADRDASE